MRDPSAGLTYGFDVFFKKTPQLKHSIVADWLDTPGSVVKKTSAVPLKISMDAAESGFRRCRRPVT